MKGDVLIELSLYAEGESYTPEGGGIWCFYITMFEQKCPKALFEKLWLPGKQYQFSPESNVRTNYDYYDTPVSGFNWHGGVTFYERLGQDSPCRAVKFGCDYNHIWDTERGARTQEELLEDAEVVASQIIALMAEYSTPKEVPI